MEEYTDKGLLKKLKDEKPMKIVFKPLCYKVFTQKDRAGYIVQKIAPGIWIIEDIGQKNIISIGKVLAKDIFELDAGHTGKNIYYADKAFSKMTEKIVSFKRI